MLDECTALIYDKGMPIPLLQRLEKYNIQMLSVPEEEWNTLGSNVLSLGEGSILAVDGNPKTKRLLEQHRFTVDSFDGADLCLAGEGGPTCLTRFIPFGVHQLEGDRRVNLRSGISFSIR